MATQLNLAGYLGSLHSAFTPDKFRPLHLRYLSYDNLNNSFRLLLDKGDTKNPQTQELESTSKTLLNYFFIGLALPNDSFWVNLRPDSEDNVIDPYLAQTDIGRIMIETDLQLKKDTAKATSPETPEGKKYWDALYKKAEELFGYDSVTIPTLTRPWIVPGEIIIRETTNSAYIYKATLKVMLEQDYLQRSANSVQGSVDYSFKDPRLKALNEYSSQLIRELIIPKLTKEINTSKRYASLRQVYYSLIMAQWFKARFRNKPWAYSQAMDHRNLTNLTSKTSWTKATYFQEYQKSFQKGEYNLQEPRSTPFGQVIRSYFSGGEVLGIPGGVQDVGVVAGPAITAVRAQDRMPENADNLMGVEIKGDRVHVIAGEAAAAVKGRDDEIRQGESLEAYLARLKEKYGQHVEIEVVYTKETLQRKAGEHGFKGDVGGGFGVAGKTVNDKAYACLFYDAIRDNPGLAIHEITEALARGSKGVAAGGAETGILSKIALRLIPSLKASKPPGASQDSDAIIDDRGIGRAYFMPEKKDIETILTHAAAAAQQSTYSRKPIIVSIGSGYSFAEYLLASEASVVAVEPRRDIVRKAAKDYQLREIKPGVFTNHGENAGFDLTLIIGSSEDAIAKINQLGWVYIPNMPSSIKSREGQYRETLAGYAKRAQEGAPAVELTQLEQRARQQYAEVERLKAGFWRDHYSNVDVAFNAWMGEEVDFTERIRDIGATFVILVASAKDGHTGFSGSTGMTIPMASQGVVKGTYTDSLTGMGYNRTGDVIECAGHSSRMYIFEKEKIQGENRQPDDHGSSGDTVPDGVTLDIWAEAVSSGRPLPPGRLEDSLLEALRIQGCDVMLLPQWRINVRPETEGWPVVHFRYSIVIAEEYYAKALATPTADRDLLLDVIAREIEKYNAERARDTYVNVVRIGGDDFMVTYSRTPGTDSWSLEYDGEAFQGRYERQLHWAKRERVINSLLYRNFVSGRREKLGSAFSYSIKQGIKAYSRLCGVNLQSKIGELLDLNSGREVRILDIGCKGGVFLGEVSQKFAKEFTEGRIRLYGVTPAADKSHVPLQKQGVDIRVAETEFLPFEDSFFDLVISAGGIQDSYDPLLSVEEISRILRSPGRAYLYIEGENLCEATRQGETRPLDLLEVLRRNTKGFKGRKFGAGLQIFIEGLPMYFPYERGLGIQRGEEDEGPVRAYYFQDPHPQETGVMREDILNGLDTLRRLSRAAQEAVSRNDTPKLEELEKQANSVLDFVLRSIQNPAGEYVDSELRDDYIDTLIDLSLSFSQTLYWRWTPPRIPAFSFGLLEIILSAMADSDDLARELLVEKLSPHVSSFDQKALEKLDLGLSVVLDPFKGIEELVRLQSYLDERPISLLIFSTPRKSLIMAMLTGGTALVPLNSFSRSGSVRIYDFILPPQHSRILNPSISGPVELAVLHFDEKGRAKLYVGDEYPEQKSYYTDQDMIREICEDMGLVSKGISHPEEPNALPPYTGSGDTAIHVALDEARKMIGQGNTAQAKTLLEELLKDLKDAQSGMIDIETLMQGWYKRYPSDLEVPLRGDHLGLAISQTNVLLRQAEQQIPILEKPANEVENLEADGKKGGIDFRSLPIVTQAIGNLRVNLSDATLQRLSNVNLNEQLQQIQRMVNAGITPSSERIKEYVQASCFNDNSRQNIDKIILCISDIMRQEEETCVSTEPILRDILVVLESAGSTKELKEVFLGKGNT